MSDGTPGERPQGAPNQRALGAMESAVRRARERAGLTTVPGRIQEDTQPVVMTPPLPPPTMPPPATPVGSAPMPNSNGESAGRERWLVVSVAVVAALVVIAGIALAVSSASGGPQSTTPPSSAPGTTGHAATPPASRHPHTSPRTGSSSSTTTTSSAPQATPGGPPVIASISPSRGAAGQGIQVAGSNFLSSDGQIVASFNGQVAPTSCPAANTCTVTVPPMSGSQSAEVTITTAGGTSNSVTFTYS